MSRDGEVCTICHEVLDRHVQDPRSDRYITFDHIEPRSRGGTDVIHNLRLAHQQCNVQRGNDPLKLEEEG